MTFTDGLGIPRSCIVTTGAAATDAAANGGGATPPRWLACAWLSPTCRFQRGDALLTVNTSEGLDEIASAQAVPASSRVVLVH